MSKDPDAVTGYLRKGQDLKAKLKSLFMRLEASEQNPNN